MDDDFSTDEPSRDGLIDDDPALDYILYETIQKKDKQNNNTRGNSCLGVILLFLLPASIVSYFLFV